jgi:hypothetical protein
VLVFQTRYSTSPHRRRLSVVVRCSDLHHPVSPLPRAG